MRLLIAALVATFAAADLIEFGVADLRKPPQWTSGDANEQWHLLTAADAQHYRTQLTASYTKRGGLVVIQDFVADNCCVAMAAGKMLAVGGSTMDVSSKATCARHNTFVKGGRLQFTDPAQFLDKSKEVTAVFDCVASHNPAIYYRLEKSSRHCHVGMWAAWSECSRSCGGGEHVRRRAIVVAPKNRGRPCPSLSEARPCNDHACSVAEPEDCKATPWGTWSSCSVSCGHGYQRRLRTWDRAAKNAGALCPLPDKQVRACSDTPHCPSDCALSAWSGWGACSKRCGGGEQMRVRTIVRDVAYGGQTCGAHSESRKCNTQVACPVDCVVSGWTACTRSCGGGQTSPIIKVDPAHGGKACPLARRCNAQACSSCSFSDWSNWGTCQAPCGGGRRSRTRAALGTGKGAATCQHEHELIEFESCNKHACPVDCRLGGWGAWSECSKTCGDDAKRTRVAWIERPAVGLGTPCGATKQVEACLGLVPCPVDCSETWSPWGPCSTTCGVGQRKRQKTRTPASNGGKACPVGAVTQQTENCKLADCAPTKCKVNQWGAWSICSKTCGVGIRRRSRKVTEGTESAADCPKLNDFEECNAGECPVDCVAKAWGAWDSCNAACGGGWQSRKRGVVTEAANGGHACTRRMWRQCNTKPCRVNCQMGQWSAWEPCSNKCGTGEQSRFRPLLVAPQNGGTPCGEPSNAAIQKRQCTGTACACPSFGEWDECTQPCGGGTQTRSRDLSSANNPDIAHLWSRCAPREVRTCNTKPCAHDCVLEPWSAFSQCTRTCGGGTKSRSRNVHRHATGAGKRCVGALRETVVCNSGKCPIDCTLQAWQPWEDCSATCGGGTRTRRRSQLTSAAFGGVECPESAYFETEACDMRPCPVHCTVSSWSSWQSAPCSKLCNGIQVTRRGVDVQAAHGGRTCPALMRSRPCNVPRGGNGCDKECKVTNWSNWGSCSVPCGDGTRTRSRSISNGWAASKCAKQTLETEPCNDKKCSKDCTFEQWGSWSTCNAKCGGGVASRSRNIKSGPTGNGKCSELDRHQSKPCATAPCPVTCILATSFGEWGPCSEVCGSGKQHRFKAVIREGMFGAQPCPKLASAARRQTRECNRQACDLKKDVCKVSNWGNWGGCSVKCGGGGVQVRTRTVTNSMDDSQCPALTDEQECGTAPCPVDCKTTDLKAWGPCSKTCGGGFQTGHRIILQRPLFGGKTCPPLTEDRECNNAREHPCPQDCQVSPWQAWTPCSHTCGGGKRTRRRSVRVQARLWGQSCPHLEQTGSCGNHECPIDCVESWGQWSECSRSCGVGFKRRAMSKVAGAGARFGGKGCSMRHEQEVCNAAACPVDCATSMWSDWGECSASCGGGIVKRYRSVLRMFAFAGKPCGQTMQSTSCNTQKCPPKDCDYTAWTEWSTCSSSGEQQRTRDIAQQASTDGVQCDAKEQREVRDCAIDCELHDWGEWSSCSKTCGIGIHSRTREIKTPAQYGGKKCVGQRAQSTQCNNGLCQAVPCTTTNWGAWTQCSKSCGSGQQQRRRMWVASVYKQNVGGLEKMVACRTHSHDTQMVDVRSCHVVKSCPRDCKMSTWSVWTQCSKTCGGGKQRRFRMRKAAPKDGGKACGAFMDERECQKQLCPVDCEYTSWGAWAPVKGQGTEMKRTRTVTRRDSHGGRECPKTWQIRQFSELCQNRVQFSAWTDCTKSCGSGYRYRYREVHVCSHQAVLKYKLRHRQGERCNTHECPTAREQSMLRGALV